MQLSSVKLRDQPTERTEIEGRQRKERTEGGSREGEDAH